MRQAMPRDVSRDAEALAGTIGAVTFSLTRLADDPELGRCGSLVLNGFEEVLQTYLGGTII